MVVYTNADFISLNEENLTYSVLVEDKGKIAYRSEERRVGKECRL